MIDRSPDSLILGVRHFQSGNHALAEQVFRQLLENDQENGNAWCCLGIACRAQGKSQEAAQLLERAAKQFRDDLTHDPESIETYLHLANTLVEQGKYDEAIATFRKAREVRPDAIGPAFDMGVMYANRGMITEALEQYAEALRIRPGKAIQVEIAPGELIDKITILEIKQQRLSEARKLRNVRHELGLLTATLRQSVTASDELSRLTDELKRVNESLWQVEDEIRICERDGDFGPTFVQLARSVYRLNDKRAAFKRQINELLGSAIVEEKGYESY